MEGAPFGAELLDTAFNERVGIVTLSFGDATPAIARFRAAGATVIVQVQDLAQARAALSAGADFVIAQGNEAGGHTGLRGTMSFAAQVLDLAEKRQCCRWRWGMVGAWPQPLPWVRPVWSWARVSRRASKRRATKRPRPRSLRATVVTRSRILQTTRCCLPLAKQRDRARG